MNTCPQILLLFFSEIRLLPIVYDELDGKKRLRILLNLMSKSLIMTKRWPDFDENTVQVKRKLNEYYTSVLCEEKWKTLVCDSLGNQAPEMEGSIQEEIRELFYAAMHHLPN